MVKRIYPQLIANKITSVQPLLGPTGLIHYLRYRYSSNKGNLNPSIDEPILEQPVKPKKQKIYRPIDAPWEQPW